MVRYVKRLFITIN